MVGCSKPLTFRRPSLCDCNSLGLKPCACALSAELQSMDVVDLTLEPETPTAPHPKRPVMDSRSMPVAWPNKYADIGITPHPASKYKRSRVVSYSMWEVGVRKPTTRCLDQEFKDVMDSCKRLKIDTTQTKVTDYMYSDKQYPYVTIRR